MKNNQFKKFIRDEIELNCKALDFISIYVDISNNSRKIYIYTLDYRFAGIFSCWFTDDSIHLQFTNLKTLPLIQHKVKNINVKYPDFDKVLEEIRDAFDIMDRTEV